MVGSGPPPLPRSLPSWSCPRWAPLCKHRKQCPWAPETQGQGIHSHRGGVVCAAAGDPQHTHLPTAWPCLTARHLLQAALSQMHRVRPEVGLFRAPEGSGSQLCCQLLISAFIRGPGEVSRPARCPTANRQSSELSSSAAWRRSWWTHPRLAPHRTWGRVPPSLLPHPALLGPQVTAPGSFWLLVLPGRWTLGARRYPVSGVLPKDKSAPPLWCTQGKDSQ